MIRILSDKEQALYKCHKCGSMRSVKYSIDGKTYCNKCALEIIAEQEQEFSEDLHMEQIEQM